MNKPTCPPKDDPSPKITHFRDDDPEEHVVWVGGRSSSQNIAQELVLFGPARLVNEYIAALGLGQPSSLNNTASQDSKWSDISFRMVFPESGKVENAGVWTHEHIARV